MLRFARHFATTTLILLTVVLVGSWIRSYYVYDHLGWQRYRFAGEQLRHQTWSIGCVRGRLIFYAATTDLEPRETVFAHLSAENVRTVQQTPALFWRSFPAVRTAEWEFPSGSILNKMGFVIVRGLDRGPWVNSHPKLTNLNPVPYFSRSSSFRTVMVPHWFALLILLPVSWISIVRLVRREIRGRRVRRGLCGNCGYNLRATPERCPECGAIPSAPDDQPRIPRMARIN